MEFRITYDGLDLYAPQNGKPLLDATWDGEAGAAGTLTFRIPPTHPYHDLDFSIRNANKEVRLLQDGEELFRGRIIRLGEDDSACVRVEAEGQLAYLADSVVRPYATYDADDASDGTQFVGSDLFVWEIDQHNLRVGPEKSFVCGHVPHTAPRTLNSSYSTTLDDLKDVYCEGQDRYLNARSSGSARIIDLLDGGVGEGTQAVVLGENLISVEATREASDIVTAIIPVGRTSSKSGENPGTNPFITDPDDDTPPVDDPYIDPPETDDTEGDPDRTNDNDYRDESRDFRITTLLDGSYNVGDTSVRLQGGTVIGELASKYGIIEEQRDYEAGTQEELLSLAAADLSPSNLSMQEVSSVVVSAVDLNALNPEIEPIRILCWYHVYSKAHRIDQWIPCSKVHLVLGDPSSSYYRFGDLPATLTRRSALRMGMLRRGTGDLIRRATGQKWNTDRTWDEVEDVSHKVDDTVKDFTDKIDKVEKSDREGREELFEHLEEIAGPYDPETGEFSGEGLLGETKRDLMDGIAQVAKDAQLTFFGRCMDDGSARDVFSQNITKPGGAEFQLVEGAVIDVLMEYAHEGSCTLNVAGTGDRNIVTNGDRHAVWQANKTVRFLYDGTNWQACSVDLYGRSITVGNPAQGNFHSDGYSLDMNIGSTSYFHVDAAGERIGLSNQRHVFIDNQGMSIEGNRNEKIFSFGVSSSGYSEITAESERSIDIRSENSFTDSDVLLTPSDLYLSGGSQTHIGGQYILIGNDSGYENGLGFFGNSFSLNHDTIVLRSVRLNGDGSEYLTISASTLGISDPGGYAFAISNGDMKANNFFVVGSQVNGSSRSIQVKFDRSVSGALRLNVLGVPVGAVATSDPENPEGPEIFDDQRELTETGPALGPEASNGENHAQG